MNNERWITKKENGGVEGNPNKVHPSSKHMLHFKKPQKTPFSKRNREK